VRPIAFIDIESTGIDPAKDKILTLAINRPEGSAEFKFNPGIPIPAEATAIHGITNEMAKKWSSFAAAHGLAITRSLGGCDIGGFNHINFDVPMLWEELHRVGFDLNLEGVNLIDVGNIFKKKEERTLAAAVKFYCGHEHKSAHTSDGDVLATSEVFDAQLVRYEDLSLMTRKELADFSHFDDRIDLAGKIVRDKGWGRQLLDRQG